MADYEESVITDRGGNELRWYVIQGRAYPKFPIESLQHVFKFKARPDDILLCTYPKCGTHWTFMVIHYLLAGTTDLPICEKDDTMIENKSPAHFDDLPSPRNVNTHFNFDTLSPDFLRQKCKIIYMTRDPRDAAVSQYNHLIDSKQIGYTGEWKDFFHLFLEGQVSYDGWFKYTKGWEKGMRENPEQPVLKMSYEAMKQDPLKEMKRINEFLDTGRSEALMEEIVEKTSFNAMKNARVAEGKGMLIMYRKGVTGDWKNWFTVSQSEEFNEVFEKEMQGTEAYKLYSHMHTATG